MKDEPLKIKTIAVIGGGCFGTAVANTLCDSGMRVTQWMRNQTIADQINTAHKNGQYLPSITLNEKLVATTDISLALQGAEILFIAIPSSQFRSIVQLIKDQNIIQPSTILVSTTKGIEANGFHLMSEIIHELLPENPVAVLSGPNLAIEISNKNITGSVVACPNPAICDTIQACFRCDYFKTYANSDLYGVELAGTLKNIYAIAAGMLSSMDFGENTKSFLITRSLAEMSRFAVALGANPLTFLGLAGVGDLIATCSSNKSRNFRVGVALGEGLALEEAVEKLGETAEGVNTLKTIAQKASQAGVYMPIVFGLHEIIFEQRSPLQVLKPMMQTAHKQDVEFINA